MRRIACLIALMTLSSPACARGFFSFTFHGHRVHIPAHCRSLSCISVSGIGRRRDRDKDAATTNDPAPVRPAPAAPPQMQPVPVPPLPAPARPPLVTARIPVPAITRAARPVAPPAAVAAPTLASVPPSPPPAVSVEMPGPQQGPTPPAPAAETVASPVRVPQEAERATESAVTDSPLGDWQTDKNSGLVRIEACGTALCGYALDATTGAKGEPVLVNMKPKNDTKWIGNVYSRSSGNSYYGIMTLKQDHDTLRVEACALSRFFCSGSDWTRAAGKPDEPLGSQHMPGS